MPRRRRPDLLRRLLGWFLRGVILALALIVAVVVLLRWVDPPTSAFMLQYRWHHATPAHHEWVDWDGLSPWMGLAVVAAEDQRFPTHHGFDFDQISRALQQRAEGGRLRGASTISQQVAKNLFLTPSRSFLRKGLEAGLTLIIETTWPKRRILEVYLNVARFTPDAFGVGAASRQVYGVSPRELDRWQAARLAAVLPNPLRFDATSPSNHVLQRQSWIVRQMEQLGGPDYLAGL